MLQDVINKDQQYLDDVKRWSEEQYSTYFGPYFVIQETLSSKFAQSTEHVDLTDEELTDVLTKLPLDLVMVSAKLSEFKTQQEVIKMRIKQQQAEFINRWKNNLADGYTITMLKEDAANLVVEDKLLVTVYDSIIQRVEKQLSYSRELIMGCKKIWDSRRVAEGPVPMVDTSDQLKPYEFDSGPTPSKKPTTYIS